MLSFIPTLSTLGCKTDTVISQGQAGDDCGELMKVFSPLTNISLPPLSFHSLYSEEQRLVWHQEASRVASHWELNIPAVPVGVQWTAISWDHRKFFCLLDCNITHSLPKIAGNSFSRWHRFSFKERQGGVITSGDSSAALMIFILYMKFTILYLLTRTRKTTREKFTSFLT